MATPTDLFCCPACKQGLKATAADFFCESCNRTFPIVDGIPDLFVSHSESDAIDEPNKTWLLPEIVEARDTYYSLSTRDLKGMAFCIEKMGELTFAGCHVLEVGMGTGHFTRWLAEVSQPGTQIFAFDFSWPVIHKARVNTAGLEDIVIFRANSRGRLPFADAAFDIVFLRLAPLGAHGTPNVAAAFDLLKPGGWFFEAGWEKEQFETPRTEWAIKHGFESAEHHTWQYQRILSRDEYLARRLELEHLEAQFKKVDRSFPRIAARQLGQEGVVTMTQENLLIAQKPSRSVNRRAA